MNKTALVVAVVLAAGLAAWLVWVGGRRSAGGAGGDTGSGREVVAACAAPKEVPELVEWLDVRISSGEAKGKSEALEELNKAETVDRLKAVVDDGNQPVGLRQRTLLLLARGRRDSQDVAALVVRHSADAGSPVHSVAVAALCGFSNLEHLDADGAVSAALASAAGSEDASMRDAAVRGLAKLNSRAAVLALVERLSDSDPLVRKLAAGRLKLLAGGDFGYVYSRLPGGQKEAIGKYRAWAEAYKPGA